MFIYDLFEDAKKRVVVTYPGRFQPFHKGHRDVFASLQRKFGNENVFIVTSNKTDAVKSPFNFSDKVRFMHAMGVPDNQVIETDKVYDLPPQFANIKDQVVFITVVGAPDAKRLNPGATKKDGSPSYFQNLPGDAGQLQSADEHGYVIVEPEHPENISIGGKTYDVSHGTPTRELWNQIRHSPEHRAEFITQLYGANDQALGNVLDKIPTGAEPAPEPAKKMKNVKKDLTKVQHDPNAEQPVAEAGYGRNRGYNHGFASPTAPRLGGRREDDEYINGPDRVDVATWYIRINGKIVKDKTSTPYQFRGREAAVKAARTMMAKPFNAGKQFTLSTSPTDREQGVVKEFAPPGSGGDGDSDYNYLQKLAQQIAAVLPQDTVSARVFDYYDIVDYLDFHPKILQQLDDLDATSQGAVVDLVANIFYEKNGNGDVDEGAIITKDDLVDIYIKGVGKNNMPIQKKVGAQIPNGKVNSFIATVAEKYGLNPKVFVYGPSNPVAEGKWFKTDYGWAGGSKPGGGKYKHPDQLKADREAKKKSKEQEQEKNKQPNVTETVLNPQDPKSDYEAKRKALHDLSLDKNVDQKHVQQRRLDLDKEAKAKGVAEGSETITHRIGLTVTDPNHPMVSKRGETYHKTVRVKGDDREKAINGAIAHYRRKGYKVHDHHYIGTVDDEPMAEGKKPDNYHIVNKDGKPASLASYADRASAEKDRDAKHPGAEVRQVGPRGKVKGVSEGLPQTLRKVVPGYAKREIDKKMDAEKFGKTDADRDANYWRYKKIQDKLKEQGVAEAGPFSYGKAPRKGSVADLAAKKRKEQERGQQPIEPKDQQVGLAKVTKGVAEVSQQTLQSYRKKASAQKRAADDVVSGDADDETWKKNVSLSAKRRQGIDAANKRLGVAEDAEPMDREFLLVKKLGRLGQRIVQNPKLWDKYSEENDSGDPDWIISLIQDGTGATFQEVLRLSDLFGEIGGGMGRIIDFAWAVKEGHWEEDFLNPYREYRSKWDMAESGLGLDHKRNRFKSLHIGEEAAGVGVVASKKQAKDPRYSMSLTKDVRPGQVNKSLRAFRLAENAEELSVGDPVVITGKGIEFEGKTGDIDSFGDMKRFVVVNLYNHGKHSFHSSDVSYNDYADQEDDLDEDLYQYDKEDPYNSEFAPQAGMGRMTLRGWKQQMIKRTAELAQQMAAAGQDIDKSAIWDHVHAKLKSMNMDPIAQEIEQAQAELEKIRQRGGIRSRAFNK